MTPHSSDGNSIEQLKEWLIEQRDIAYGEAAPSGGREWIIDRFARFGAFNEVLEKLNNEPNPQASVATDDE